MTYSDYMNHLEKKGKEKRERAEAERHKARERRKAENKARGLAEGGDQARNEEMNNQDPETPRCQRASEELDSGSGLSLFSRSQEALVNERVLGMEIRRRGAIAWLRERLLRKEAVMAGIVYILFMTTYFYIVLDQTRVADAHKLEFSLRNYLTSTGEPQNGDEIGDATTFAEITGDEELWYWLENGLLDALFPETSWYNGDPWQAKDQDFIMHYNRLIGGFKMVQRRVQDDWDGCIKSKRFNGFYDTCWPAYSDASKQTTPYGPEHDPGKYVWEDDPYGGGYSVELSLDRKKAYLTIDELKQDLWTDKNTRQLAIEFSIYNGNMQLFSKVNAEINISPTGRVETSYNMETFRVELYRTVSDWIRCAVEVIFLIFVTYSALAEFYELITPPVEFGKKLEYKEHLRRYFGSFWNWIDLSRIVMFCVVIASYAAILTHPQSAGLELPLPDGQKYPDLGNLALAWRSYKRINGFNVVLCLLTIFKFMNKSPRYGVLVRTIGRAAADLTKFAIMFFLCMASFVIMGILMFGSALEEWSTPWNAFQVLFMMITGEYGYEPLLEVDPVGAPIFFFLFLVIVFFLLVNILLAIMMDAYATIREDLDAERQELELKYDFPILSEIVRDVLNKASRFLSWYKPAVFLNTEDILERLENDEHMVKDAWFDLPPATVNNPDPEPEEVIPWDILSEVYPVDEARFMMILVGQPIDQDADYVTVTDTGATTTAGGNKWGKSIKALSKMAAPDTPSAGKPTGFSAHLLAAARTAAKNDAESTIPEKPGPEDSSALSDREARLRVMEASLIEMQNAIRMLSHEVGTVLTDMTNSSS